MYKDIPNELMTSEKQCLEIRAKLTNSIYGIFGQLNEDGFGKAIRPLCLPCSLKRKVTGDIIVHTGVSEWYITTPQ